MVYLGTDTITQGTAMGREPGAQVVSLPGLLAAATWAIGLVIGLVALTVGHELLAGVSLLLALMSPWFGLAWVAHGQRSDARRERSALTAGQNTSYAGGWPAPSLSR